MTKLRCRYRCHYGALIYGITSLANPVRLSSSSWVGITELQAGFPQSRVPGKRMAHERIPHVRLCMHFPRKRLKASTCSLATSWMVYPFKTPRYLFDALLSGSNDGVAQETKAIAVTLVAMDGVTPSTTTPYAVSRDRKVPTRMREVNLPLARRW